MKTTILLYLFALMLSVSPVRGDAYPVTKHYTYLNDIYESTTDDIAIMADPNVCKPFIGFLSENRYQAFRCVYQNSTQENNNLITFNYPIKQFPYFSNAFCFTAYYPTHAQYQSISSC
jgi:hypothetical protein